MSEPLPREIFGIVGMFNDYADPSAKRYLCAFDVLRVPPWDSGVISLEFTPKRSLPELDLRRGRTYYFCEWAKDAVPLARIFPYITREYHGFLEYMTHSDGTPSARTAGQGVFYLTEQGARDDMTKYDNVIDRMNDSEAPA
jgi:hypothetical protein